MSRPIPHVVAVHRSSTHTFSKAAESSVALLAGLGVEGDAHCGATVRHRSRVAVDPSRPNLRQVHLLPIEVIDDLRRAGYDVSPGDLGENITTCGLDLHGLPTGSLLRIGGSALIALTGLRNPCQQIETFRTGLRNEVLGRGDGGVVVRRAGVMAVVVEGGEIGVDDVIEVGIPPGSASPLAPV